MTFAYNEIYRSGNAIEQRHSVRVPPKRPLHEGELREGEALFCSLAEMTSAAVYIFQGERCVYFNRNAETLTGYNRDELLATKLQYLLPPAKQMTMAPSSKTGQRIDPATARHERKVLTKEGQERWHEIAVSQIMFQGRSSLLVICFDITERKRVEQELQSLTSRLLHLQDEERRCIARELHDVTAQNLFAITINLARLQQGFLRPSDVSELLTECRTLGEQSLQEIRTLSYLLHPPMLDQAGLVSALQWFIEGFIKRSGIYVDLVVKPDVGRLDAQVETALFRVVQESLTNIHRHSGSGLASIRLEIEGAHVCLRISDAGRGLPPVKCAAVTQEEEHLGVGIAGMRQRLRQLGGSLEIQSSSQGTVVTAIFPLNSGDPLSGGGKNDAPIAGG